MHLHDLYGWPGPITHRQFVAWLVWLSEEQNRPSRTDYHIMRVAQRVQQVMRKNPNAVKLDHQQVKFERNLKQEQVASVWGDEDDGPPGPLTEEQYKVAVTEAAKMDIIKRQKALKDGTRNRS